MDIQLFIKKFENEFNDLPKGNIKPETKIVDLKDWWDSINVMITYAFVMGEFGVEIEKSDIFESITINDFYNKILKKSGNK
jgi:acyl carrier protein